MSQNVPVRFVKQLPNIGRGGRPEAPWRAKLRARPGEWAILMRYKRGTNASVSGYRRIPGFEFTTRKLRGALYLFGRYTGKKVK